MAGSIKIEGQEAVIRIPLDDVHSLCVALEGCPCGASKSTATLTIRDRLKKGLARAMAGRLSK